MLIFLLGQAPLEGDAISCMHMMLSAVLHLNLWRCYVEFDVY